MAQVYSQSSFQIFNAGPNPMLFSFNGNAPTYTVFGAIVPRNWQPGSMRSPLNIYTTPVSDGPGIGVNILTTFLQGGTEVETFKISLPDTLGVNDKLQLLFGPVNDTTIWWVLLRDGQPMQFALPNTV